jgi:hypothetical protein
MSWPARVLQAEHSDVYASASYFTAEEACGFLRAALASGAVRRCGSLVVLCVSYHLSLAPCLQARTLASPASATLQTQTPPSSP